MKAELGAFDGAALLEAAAPEVNAPWLPRIVDAGAEAEFDAAPLEAGDCAEEAKTELATVEDTPGSVEAIADESEEYKLLRPTVEDPGKEAMVLE